MASSNGKVENRDFSGRGDLFAVANVEIGASAVSFLWSWVMKATIESGFT